MTNPAQREPTMNEFTVPDAVWEMRDYKSLRLTGPCVRSVHSDRDRFLLGVFGLTGMFACVCTIMAGFVVVVSNFNVSPPVGTEVYWIKSFFGTSIAVLAFAAVSPTLYQQNVVLRFLCGIGALVPGCVLFMGAMRFVAGGPTASAIADIALLVFACYLSIILVSFGIELWTPWALTTDSQTTPRLRRTGIRCLVELMTISAVSMTFFSLFGHHAVLLPALVFAGIGFVSAMIVSVFLLTVLRPEIGRRRLCLIVVSAASITSLLSSCLAVSLQSGIGSVTAFPQKTLGVLIFGLLQYTVIFTVILAWLRYCGWSSTNHRRFTNSSETASNPLPS